MGIVFDIQRFCVNDGPGIRSVVFLKGCPLKCLWCHNPESNTIDRQLYCEWTKCRHCGKCITVCPDNVHIMKGEKHVVQFDKCRLCGACTKICPNEALGIYGTETEVKEILEEVEKDREYYETSGGGVTISGGEPMYQFTFTLELARRLKSRGIHVCMETSGFGASNRFKEIAPFIDLFLYDYKATGNVLHRKLTGVDGTEILENMKNLISMGRKVVLRCPIIPGYNLSQEHLRAIAEISQEGVAYVEIIPYHDMGIGKAKKIGSDMYIKKTRVPEQSEVDSWIGDIEGYGGIHVRQA